MEFVDYKCLESLLIEGEEMIATEGAEEILSNIITSFKKACLKIFGIIKNILLKIKHKITSKYTQEDVDNINKTHKKEMNEELFKTSNAYNKEISEMRDKHDKEMKTFKNNSNDKYKRVSSALITSALSIGERYLDAIRVAVANQEQTIATRSDGLRDTIYARMDRFESDVKKFNNDFKEAIENIPDDIILDSNEKSKILDKIDKNLIIIDKCKKSIENANDETYNSERMKIIEFSKSDINAFIKASNLISNELMKCEKLYMDLNTKVSKALS